MTGERSETMTIVIHLPQRVERVTRILRVLAEEWPEAAFTDGFAHLEIPADE